MGVVTITVYVKNKVFGEGCIPKGKIESIDWSSGTIIFRMAGKRVSNFNGVTKEQAEEVKEWFEKDSVEDLHIEVFKESFNDRKFD